jgi:hypothetical protein
MEKLEKTKVAGAAGQVIDVLCEPRAGQSPATVAQWLTDLGAPKVQFLGGGFIAAQIHREDMTTLSKVAVVSEKKLSQPRPAAG